MFVIGHSCVCMFFLVMAKCYVFVMTEVSFIGHAEIELSVLIYARVFKQAIGELSMCFHLSINRSTVDGDGES